MVAATAHLAVLSGSHDSTSRDKAAAPILFPFQEILVGSASDWQLNEGGDHFVGVGQVHITQQFLYQ